MTSATQPLNDGRILPALGLDFVDLYLWPLPAVDRYLESRRATIRLRKEGILRSIGVSNVTATHLHRLVGESDVDAISTLEFGQFRDADPDMREELQA